MSRGIGLYENPGAAFEELFVREPFELRFECFHLRRMKPPGHVRIPGGILPIISRCEN